MLTPTEKSGLRDILDDFSDADLFALVNTISKGLTNATDRNEAIQVLLQCSENPSDLLRRQKVTKKILFSYLLKTKPFVPPESTKSDLVKMCLSEWRSLEEYKNNEYESNEGASNVSDDLQNNFDWLSVMGTQFATWFFPMYNTLQDFGPEHFWPDCKLIGELKTANDKREAAVIGANEVVNFLRSLIMNDRFYFAANTSRDSVIGEQDPHGLVRISVSGVVHQMSNCIGLFDSFFGLVRNRDNDNWPIKWIHIKIHVNSITPGSLSPVSHLASICQRT